MPQIRKPPVRQRIEAISLHGAESFLDALAHILAAVKRNNSTTPRHKIHQPLERSLHCRKVGIDIRMIELHMRQNQGIRKVMKKLRPFIEERGIVLIALQQKRLRRTDLETGSEILCD